jgi:hypothetical protein
MIHQLNLAPPKMRLATHRWFLNRLGDAIPIVCPISENGYLYDLGARFEDNNGGRYKPDGTLVNPDRPSLAWDLVGITTHVNVLAREKCKQHPEIGYDNQQWSGFDPSVRHYVMAEGVGPHNDRELSLMVAGLKPFASVSNHRWNASWEQAIMEHGWSVYQDDKARYVLLPGEEWRYDVYVNLERTNQFKYDSDIILGTLFGYRLEDITAFVKRLQLMNAYVEYGKSQQETLEST